MPEETKNRIHIPIRKISLFLEESIKTFDISVKEGIQAVGGKLKDNPEPLTIQKYIFDKGKGWTMDKAKEWVKNNKKSNIINDNKNMSKQEIKALVTKAEDGELFAVASDDSVDRHGDKLDQKNWSLTQFKKNPVLLMAHQYHLPPVGVAKNIKVDGNKLTFKPVFHEITQMAREVKEMYLDGIMKAFSVGFIDRTDEKNEKQTLELLEISAVPVPANANALLVGKSIEEAEKMDSEVKGWVDKTLENKEVKPENEEVFEKALSDLISLKEIELKEGRILSQANLNKIKEVISVLSALVIKVEGEPEKAVKPTTIKGRPEPKQDVNKLLLGALESLNKNLGYIKRKLK